MATTQRPDGEAPALRVARYRLRQIIAGRWGGYLALVLVVAILGGLSLASIAGARRTQSAFPRYLAASNPSDISIDEGPYTPQSIANIRRLPGVTSIKTYVSFNVTRLGPNGYPEQGAFDAAVEYVGSLNGLYFSQDRIALLQGRMANPHRVDEAMVSEQTASQFGVRVGDSIPVGFYDNGQVNNPSFDPFHTKPYRTLILHIVGIGEFADEVVQDDVDKIPRLLTTPALTRQFVGCCSSYAWNGLQLRDGADGVAAVERAYSASVPKGFPVYVRVTSVVEAQGERAVKPESIALGVFGLIIGLAALVLGGQAIGRQVSFAAMEHSIMRSLGASPRMLLVDNLVGTAASVVVGAVGAAAVAVALSPLAPIGVVRSIEVSPGVSFDWTILLGGMAAFLVALIVTAVLISYRQAPHRVARREAGVLEQSTASSRLAASSGLPPSAVTGIGLALNTAPSRAIPVRSAIIGTALALIMLTGAVTFGASLNNLVNHPNLYGWNWTGALIASGGYGNVPGGEAAHLLDTDHSVAAWNGVYLDSIQIDHQLVPALGATKVHASLNPLMLVGHPLGAKNQVVLGASTLADLHKHVGDTAQVSNSISTFTVRIVGVATLPTVGVGHGIHTSMGSGAWVSAALLPRVDLNTSGNVYPGPNLLFVRYSPEVGTQAASRDLARLGQELGSYNPSHVDPAALATVMPLPVQRPAEIVNYRSMGAAPIILGIGLAFGAALALTLTLAASVRRRRRELALLKSLGFTQRQLRATVMWQSSVVVLIGTIIGIPFGVALGRLLWNAFAGELHIVAQPIVPLVTVLAIAAGAVLLANLVAEVPGRAAGRTPTALVLREE